MKSKYKREGPLFQGVYKAVRITSDEQLLNVTRYIHRNPMLQPRQCRGKGQALQNYSHSSYRYYLARHYPEWLKPNEILSNFSFAGAASYQQFVEENEFDETEVNSLKHLDF